MSLLLNQHLPLQSYILVYHHSTRPFGNLLASHFYSLYQAQCISTIMVLKMFENAEGYNETEERVLNYVHQFIGNMSQEELHVFLRFVTGGAACLSNQVGVTFNSGLCTTPSYCPHLLSFT